MLWVGICGGIDRFDARTDRARHYMEHHGLASNHLHSVIEDESGTLWMSYDIIIITRGQGGKLTVEAKGAAFIVRLPAAEVVTA